VTPGGKREKKKEEGGDIYNGLRLLRREEGEEREGGRRLRPAIAYPFKTDNGDGRGGKGPQAPDGTKRPPLYFPVRVWCLGFVLVLMPRTFSRAFAGRLWSFSW